MSYFYGGFCFPENEAVISAFQSEFPRIESGAVLNRPTLVSYAANADYLSASFSALSNSTPITLDVRFPSCDVDYTNTFDPGYAFAVFAVPFSIVLFFFFFSRVGARVLSSMGIKP